jgi:hypothetical protein
MTKLLVASFERGVYKDGIGWEIVRIDEEIKLGASPVKVKRMEIEDEREKIRLMAQHPV